MFSCGLLTVQCLRWFVCDGRTIQINIILLLLLIIIVIIIIIRNECHKFGPALAGPAKTV